jgi:hypothetical protein
VKTLSPANKRDRVRMARMLADIVTECGATARAMIARAVVIVIWFALFSWAFILLALGA